MLPKVYLPGCWAYLESLLLVLVFHAAPFYNRQQGRIVEVVSGTYGY